MARTRFFHSQRKNLPLPVVFRFSSEAETKLQLTPHAHLDKMRDGTGDRLAWQTLKYRINVGSLLAAQHYGEHQDVHEAMAQAVEAVTAIGKRFVRTNRFGCSGDEFRAIGRGLDLADELQKATTRRQQRTASLQVFKDNAACGRDLPIVGGLDA